MDLGFGQSIWVITESERQSHNSSFLSLQPSSGSISGDAARNFFMRTGLPVPVLGHIWALCDIDKDGRLTADEFSIGMKLINLKLKGHELPANLPPPMLPKSAVSHGLRPMTQQQKLSYNQRFNSIDRAHTGKISGQQARNVLTQFVLPNDVLAKIWDLSDKDKDGALTQGEFAVAMHLVQAAKSGLQMPASLPPFLDPSKVGSDPQKKKEIKDIKITADEERKNNMMQGQAELMRRRRLLEQQEKEVYAQERAKREAEENRLRQLRERKAKEAEMARYKKIEEERQKAIAEHQRQVMLQKQMEDAKRQREKEMREEYALRQSVLHEREEIRKAYDQLSLQLAQITGNLSGLENRKEQLENALIESCEKREQVEADSLISLETSEKLAILVKALHEECKDNQENLQKIANERMALSNKFIDRQSGSGSAQMQAEREHIKSTGQAILDSTHDLRRSVATTNSQLEEKKLILAEDQAEIANLKQRLSSEINKGTLINGEREALRAQKKSMEASVYVHQKQKAQEEAEKRTIMLAERNRQIAEAEKAAVAESERVEQELLKRKALELQQKQQQQQEQQQEQPQEIITATTATTTANDPFALENKASGGSRRGNRRKVGSEDIASGLNAAFSGGTNDSNPFGTTDPFAPTTEMTSTSSDPFNNPFSSQDLSATQEGAPVRPPPPSSTTTTTSEPEPQTVDEVIPLEQPEQYIALYDYKTEESTDLQFSVNDIITVTVKCEDGWWSGEVNDKAGWFPAVYVEEYVDVAAASQTSLASAGLDDDLPAPTGSMLFNSGTFNDSTMNIAPPEDEPELPPPVVSTDDLSSIPSAFEPPEVPAPEPEPISEPSLSSTGDSGGGGEWYTALYSYTAETESDLGFEEGDQIFVLEKVDDGWWSGTCNSKSGWFPSNYVAPSQHEENKVMRRESSHGLNAERANEWVTALHDYEPQNPDELGFKEGEVFLLLQKDTDDGWWEGSHNGVNGWFPANRVSINSKSQSAITPIAEESAPPDSNNPFGNYSSDQFASKSSLSEEVPKEEVVKPAIAKVIEDFEAEDDSQLSMKKGDLIQVTLHGDEYGGWWEGSSSKKGEETKYGWFPAECVKLMSKGKKSKKDAQPKLPKFRALYDFSPSKDDELGFLLGDTVMVIEKTEEDWWKGRLDNGQEGLFPSSYVEPM